MVKSNSNDMPQHSHEVSSKQHEQHGKLLWKSEQQQAVGRRAMANNAHSRKPTNGVSSRFNYKPLKLDMPQLSRSFQLPTVVSVNAKDANKDKTCPADRKLKSTTLRSNGNPKPYSKRLEVGEPVRAPPAVAKAATMERTVVLTRHVELAQQQQQQVKHPQKPKHDGTASRTKSTRSAAVEAVLETGKHTKERKSPDKAEAPAAAARPNRIKNHSHNTKIFFDKYLKFAYDLSTPDGVRQLEAHFFPAEAPQGKQKRNKSDAGDSPEKQFPQEEKLASGNKNEDSVI